MEKTNNLYFVSYKCHFSELYHVRSAKLVLTEMKHNKTKWGIKYSTYYCSFKKVKPENNLHHVKSLFDSISEYLSVNKFFFYFLAKCNISVLLHFIKIVVHVFETTVSMIQ